MDYKYEWTPRAIELKKQGKTWKEIASAIHLEYDEGKSGLDIKELVRGQVRRNMDCSVESGSSDIFFEGENSIQAETISQTYNRDGTLEQIKRICVKHGERITPDEVLELHGLDQGLWESLSYTNNNWQMVSREEGKVDLFQSKVKAKPIVKGLAWKDFDEYLKDKIFSNVPPVFNPTQYDPNGEVLEICFPDWHSGLLSWREETGEDYDIKIAVDRFKMCIQDIVERSANRKFSKIVFSTLGDVLHIDNNMQTTTRGTFQQTDGRIAKIAIASCDALIDAVISFGKIAPTEVVYLEGNHDSVSGFMLLLAVSKAFINNDNISFDICPNPRKFRVFGNTLVGWTHGDMNKKYQGKWVLSEARKEFGDCKFVEVHVGHFHTEKTKELPFTEDGDEGIMIRHLPNIASSSSWEHKEGYPKNQKAVLSFVWNLKNGLREVWHSVI